MDDMAVEGRRASMAIRAATLFSRFLEWQYLFNNGITGLLLGVVLKSNMK
jgi:hypothetical protein